VQDIAKGEVPFISCEDLVIFKIHCCGLRGEKAKAEIDARDAMDLLDTMARPLELSPQQQSVVNAGIDSVLEHCSRKKSLSWWRKKLGLPGDCADSEEDDEKEGEQDGDAEETEDEGEAEETEEDGDVEDMEEDGEEDNTFLDSSSSIRFSFFGVVFLVMGRVRIAGVVN
jgi:hypothetical protein